MAKKRIDKSRQMDLNIKLESGSESQDDFHTVPEPRGNWVKPTSYFQIHLDQPVMVKWFGDFRPGVVVHVTPDVYKKKIVMVELDSGSTIEVISIESLRIGRVKK